MIAFNIATDAGINIFILRGIEGYFKKLARHPAYESAVASCKHEELMIPVEEGEGGQVLLSPSSIRFGFLLVIDLLLVFAGARAGSHPSPPIWRREKHSRSGLRSRRSRFVRIGSTL